MATYTVVTGDCLWTIAQRKLGDPYRWTEIAKLNNIPTNNPIIYTGQVLTLPGGSPPTPTPVKTVNTSRPTIEYMGLEAGTDNSILVLWKWNRADTESFKAEWYYYAGNKTSSGARIWIVGSDTTISSATKQAKWSAPDNAKSVKFRVKPISVKKKNAQGNEYYAWTAQYSVEKEYTHIPANLPKTPSTPSASISELKLTASLENIPEDINASYIEFEVYRDDSRYKTSKTTIIASTRRASYSCVITPGSKYRVRCRSVKDGISSDWTEFTSPIDSIPEAPSEIKILRTEPKTADNKVPVYLEWGASETAEEYEIEYATELGHFDVSDQPTSITGIKTTKYTLYDLEIGSEYFFRVRAKNGGGESAWTAIKSIPVGTVPDAPTTWSSTTTGIVGEPITLYWVHNTEDGSAQTHSKIELIVNGTTYYEFDPEGDIPEEDKYKTHHWIIDTTKYQYSEGATKQCRVQTSGVTNEWGEWSIQRTIDIYAKPTLDMSITDYLGNILNVEGDLAEVTSFPIIIHAVPGPSTQAPIGYYLSIRSKSSYETTDDLGNVKMVNAGDEVYSKYFDLDTILDVELSANDVDLDNNAEYTMSCVVTMNSGLTAEELFEFKVGWEDVQYEPNAEIAIDYQSLSAYIRPYCEDEEGNLLEGVTISVYRRDFDGSFIELIKDIPNTERSFITDPHPALDYARYRIVARTTDTGAISYYDVPGIPIGETSAIVQWNEQWSGFDASENEELAQKPWSGSLLKLPYNVDVSDSNASDVSLINYIGRKRPVTYYGTQLGETSTWNVEIDKKDKETLYALRRLSIWMEDVYVREPSGSGYWANIKVSFNQKHLAVTIPVTLTITRVEGGI